MVSTSGPPYWETTIARILGPFCWRGAPGK
jgi:hypothetical protein